MLCIVSALPANHELSWATGTRNDRESVDCVVCRYVCNRTAEAEILHKNVPVCVDCVLTGLWLQQTKPPEKIDAFHFQLQRQCKTCAAKSTQFKQVLWRYCLECCKHICGPSLNNHRCKTKKLVSLKSEYWIGEC